MAGVNILFPIFDFVFLKTSVKHFHPSYFISEILSALNVDLAKVLWRWLDCGAAGPWQ